MHGAIPPLPNTPPWRGSHLKESTGTTLPFTFWYHTKFAHIVCYFMHCWLLILALGYVNTFYAKSFHRPK
jgi:hypothetical protein